MQRFILRRLVFLVATLLLVSIIIFALARLQGDPRVAYLGQGGDMDIKTWEALGRKMGLDKPLYVQYYRFLREVMQGDFGKSIHQQRSVTTLIIQRAPTTGKLGLGAFLFALGMGIPLGILAAVKRGTIWDLLGRTFAIIGQSMPVFVIGLILIFIFAVRLGWFPTSREHGWTSFVLPAIAQGWLVSAGLLRLLRSSMLEVLDSQYILFARSKGVANRLIIWKHAFRNALIAPLTYIGLTLAWMVTGSIIIETVFALPGLGSLAIQATMQADYPLLQAIILMVAAGYLAASFLVDIVYGLVDPRIRYA